jgi:hypothetical protein
LTKGDIIVGSGVNKYLLENIASPSDYYQIDSIDQLADIFQKISSSIQKI